jgi:hypothetical protein
MKKINLIMILAGLLSLTACEEVIEVDVPENTVKLVVEGAVTTEADSSFVRLTKSVAYFDNNSTTPFVTNATVLVNNDTFYHVANGMYKPNAGYTGVTGQVYNLKILSEGKSYTSSAILDPMFTIDSVISVYKPEEGFLDAGYTVKYTGIDERPRIKYTYFRFGFKNEADTKWKDSIFDFRVLFDNRNSVINSPYEFELPFLRLQPNDSVLMIFRSVDEPVYKYLLALDARSNGGGGPFSTPPANLPSNIRGNDVLGIFMACDVKRYRYRIVE